MRTLASLTVLFFVVAGLATVTAQAPHHQPADLDNTVTQNDAAKDVAFQAGTKSGTPAQNASQTGEFEHLDILKLEFGQETEAQFKIGLFMAALDPPATSNGFAFRVVGFNYGSVEWRIFYGQCREFGQSTQSVAGCLMYRDNPAGQFRNVKNIPAEKGNGAFTFTVDKADVFNEQRLPAQYGQSLSNIYAIATQIVATTAFLPNADLVGHVSAQDLAPDGGFVKSQFTFNEGSGGHGNLALTTPDPIRVSNGEATTIVYLATVHNLGPEEISAELSTKGLRPDWSVRVPPLLKVPANGGIEFPVILTIPFTHDHGKTVMFKVRADALGDAESWAELDVGIWWTDVPQPSAHHNGEQWFHSAPTDPGPFPAQVQTAVPFKRYWLNSIEKDPDPEATDEDIPAFFNDYFACPFYSGSPNPTTCKTPPNFTASWFFPLSPSLLIGLDFDVSKTGLLVADVTASLPSSLATMEVELRYCDPEEGRAGGFADRFSNATACNNFNKILAKGSQANTLAAKSKAHFEVPLTIEPTADLLPFKRGANIGLSVKVVSDIPQNLIITEPRPLFHPKASRLFIPLIEYHDPILESFKEVGAIQITPIDPFEKPVNPGETTLFHFDIENRDDNLHHLMLEVTGVHPEWVQIIGEKNFPLNVKDRKNITIAVTAPGDAVDEERAELFIIAQSQEEPSVSGLSRFRATVTSVDVPDEGAGVLDVDAKKKSPGLELVGIAAAVAVVLVVRRRVRLA